MKRENIPPPNPLPAAYLIPGLSIVRDNGKPLSGLLYGPQSIKRNIVNILSTDIERSFLGEAQVHIDNKGRFTIPNKIINYIGYIKQRFDIGEPTGFLLTKGDKSIINMRLAVHDKDHLIHDIIYPDSLNRVSLGLDLAHYLNNKKPFIGIDITDPFSLSIIIGPDIQEKHKPFYKGTLVYILPINETQATNIKKLFPEESRISTPIKIDRGRISMPSLFIKKLEKLSNQGEKVDLFISRSARQGELLLDTSLCYDAYNIKQRKLILDESNRLSFEKIELEWLSKTDKVEIIRNPYSPFGFIIKSLDT